MFKLRIKAFPFHKISSIIYDNNISNKSKIVNFFSQIFKTDRTNLQKLLTYGILNL